MIIIFLQRLRITSVASTTTSCVNNRVPEHARMYTYGTLMGVFKITECRSYTFRKEAVMVSLLDQ